LGQCNACAVDHGGESHHAEHQKWWENSDPELIFGGDRECGTDGDDYERDVEDDAQTLRDEQVDANRQGRGNHGKLGNSLAAHGALFPEGGCAHAHHAKGESSLFRRATPS